MMRDETEELVKKVVADLTQRRHELNISKRALALKAGIDPKTVGLIERGERSPTLYTLMRISKALGLAARNPLFVVIKDSSSKAGDPS